MAGLQLSIPGEPVGKARPRVTRQGITYTPQKTVNYETLIKQHFAINYPQWIPQDSPVKIDIISYHTIPQSKSKRIKTAMEQGVIRPTKKPDADNILKIVSDSLNGLAYYDDKQIVKATLEKYYSKQPRLELRLEFISN